MPNYTIDPSKITTGNLSAQNIQLMSPRGIGKGSITTLPPTTTAQFRQFAPSKIGPITLKVKQQDGTVKDVVMDASVSYSP